MKGADFVDKIYGIFDEKPFDKAMAEIRKYKYTNEQKETILADWVLHWNGKSAGLKQLSELANFLGFKNDL